MRMYHGANSLPDGYMYVFSHFIHLQIVNGNSCPIHNTREQSAKSRTSCKYTGGTRYVHAMVNVSLEVKINSGKHSRSTHSQISAKEEAGTPIFFLSHKFSARMAARGQTQVPQQVQVPQQPQVPQPVQVAPAVNDDAQQVAPAQGADHEPTPEERLEVFSTREPRMRVLFLASVGSLWMTFRTE